MVNTCLAAEEVIYEQTDSSSKFGPVIFVTAVIRDDLRDQVMRESHVFLLHGNRHLHEITFLTNSRENEATLLAGCIRATHRLFAEQLARAGDERVSGNEGLAYVTKRLDAHPFHTIGLQNRFRDELWEIQDWTVSHTLREVLASVTCYRADTTEAELLTRIFSAA